MKHRGFTLLELVIVLALISISSLVGFRFISSMAHSQVSAAERGKTLAGARFAIERLRRELSNAYGPSVYVSADDRCLSYVPVVVAGTYTGLVRDANAEFIMPISLDQSALNNTNMAINAPSALDADLAAWQGYPADLPDNVVSLKADIIIANELSFAELFNNTSQSDFVFDSPQQRYTLLKRQQVRFCSQDNGDLIRELRTNNTWQHPSKMLSGLQEDNIFGDYHQASQLVTVDFTLATRDGDLVLSSQLQVGYEP